STIAAVRLSATKLIPNGASQDPNWVARIVPPIVAFSSAMALHRKTTLAARLARRCERGMRHSTVVNTNPASGAAIGSVSKRCADIIAWPRSLHELYLFRQAPLISFRLYRQYAGVDAPYARSE